MFDLKDLSGLKKLKEQTVKEAKTFSWHLVTFQTETQSKTAKHGCYLQKRQSHLSVILLEASLSGLHKKEFAKTADEIWTGWF